MSTAIVTKEKRAVAPPRATDIRQVMTSYLAPLRHMEAWQKTFDLVATHWHLIYSKKRLIGLKNDDSKLSKISLNRAFQEAYDIQRQLPPFAEVKLAIASVDLAIRTEAPKTTTRRLIAYMLDAFPQKLGEGAEVRFEALVWALNELRPTPDEQKQGIPDFIPATALAAAIKEAMLTLKFSPSIAELAALCGKHRKALIVEHLEPLKLIAGMCSAVAGIEALELALIESKLRDDPEAPF